ncbi:hypothetical protein PUNSTDRAFT_133795 [Punctularia strigosozonata HHB-11173 SS5]|uniref:uncharacterized protein n=1 Tax=Punctularia strigosozonata (strain HHB-11173) TaxID=741275 RepID=UPI000441653A|nr:uncharacterized protein PUNSTDRAFT_133795 [Punctularia strigosozonata HHB-11173 SS5]EIN10025.1 hypothetical protein PUNSTDRAFT_133795 [Punctularia strigosozonata HHB-11173 SS5]
MDGLRYDAPAPATLAIDAAAGHPPAYRVARRLPKLPVAIDTTGRVSEKTEHTYTLANRKGKPWLTLKLRSRAQQPSFLPSYIEGDEIAGRVELDAEGTNGIREIAVVVKGQVGSSSMDATTFVETREVIWPMASPRSPLSTNSPLSSPESESALLDGGRLTGACSWTFSLTLPGKVLLGSDGDNKVYQLPPSFGERLGVRVSVQYDVYVKVRRARFRANAKIGTMFCYMPLVRPPPLPPLRALAYRAQLPALIGWLGDPEGFEVLKPASIKTRVFHDRDVEVMCEIYLAKPLAYTRGTAIPLVVSISCSDRAALDLLNADVLGRAVRLIRHVWYDSRPGGSARAHGSPAIAEFTLGEQLSEIPVTLAHHFVASAALRVADDERDDGVALYTRRFNGEIALARDLKPTCALPIFFLQYSVAIFAPAAPGFVCVDEADTPLFSRNVEVVTAYAPGPQPRPRPFNAPGCDAGTRARAYGQDTGGRLVNCV